MLNSNEVQLADAGGVIECASLIKSMLEENAPQVDRFSIKAEGFLALSYLLHYQPNWINFFHDNPNTLSFFQLILKIISIADTPEDFISRIFSRSIEKFLDSGEHLHPFSALIFSEEKYPVPLETLRGALNEWTQWRYLARPYERDILDDTVSKLTPEEAETYNTFLFPFISGHILFENKRCKRLLPCWPISEKIPYSHCAFFAENTFEELEPNTNSFFYGNLWLLNSRNFQHIKGVLAKAEITFSVFDVFTGSVLNLINPLAPEALYVGPIYPDQFIRGVYLKEKLKHAYADKAGSLLLITQFADAELINKQTPPLRVNAKGEPMLPYNSLQESIEAYKTKLSEDYVLGAQAQFFQDLLNEHREIRSIAEIGFHAGHSSEIFLKSREDITVTSFDLMRYDYEQRSKDYIDLTFPRRHSLIPGDSNRTVPKYQLEHPAKRFDLIFVDGGHDFETALNDLRNVCALSSVSTFIIMDDVDAYKEGNIAPWSKGPTKAWKAVIEEGLISEISRMRSGGHGWAIGKLKPRLD